MQLSAKGQGPWLPGQIFQKPFKSFTHTVQKEQNHNEWKNSTAIWWHRVTGCVALIFFLLSHGFHEALDENDWIIG